MSFYLGRHAELYDLFYADKPYVDEAEFVHRCLQQYGVGPTHRLLELACGTGAHARALADKGYEIVATDNSEGMLACARRAAVPARGRLELRHQDMRALDVGERPFDAVICLFDSIGYAATNEGLAEVLNGVCRHLRPGGLFVFEFWHAAAMLRHYERLRVRRWQTPEGQVLRISETTLDYARQLARVDYSIYELRADGTYAAYSEAHVNRYFLVQEMAGWVQASGLTPLKWFAGFSLDEGITDEVWHVVAVVRRE